LFTGKIPGLESSAPSSGYYNKQMQAADYTSATSSGSCDSDCETYSYTRYGEKDSEM